MVSPARRDAATWTEAYRSFPRWADERNEDDDWTDLDGEAAYLRTWIAARDAHMAAWVADRCGTTGDDPTP